LDELPPQTRKLLQQIQALVHSECQRQDIAQRDFRFSRKNIRDFTQWSDGQLKIHCKRLEDMEYLLVHRGGRGHAIEYELLYNGDMDSDSAQMMGLLDVKSLGYDAQKSGAKQQKSGPSQAQVRARSALEKTIKAAPVMAYSETDQCDGAKAQEAQKAQKAQKAI
jgi:hypothetical protein